MKLLFRLLLIAGLLPVFNATAQQKSSAMNNEFEHLTAFFQDQCNEHGVVGGALAIIQNGETIYKTTHGVKNLESKAPVTDSTIFHWASITKTFTGIAIMQLRDRGLLSLDDPVTKYLPELRDVHNPYGSMDGITIRHLMTHSAGFRNPTWPWGGSEEWHPHEPQNWEQIVAMFPYTKILFEPGSDWSYSNPGIIFLGRIIETITLDDYEYYIQKNILAPLEMHRSYFDRTPRYLLDDLAHSYFQSEDGSYQEGRFNLNTGITVSNGGLNAPIGDMMKYLNFLLGNADKEAYEFILNKSSLSEMFTPQIAVSDDGSDAPENAGGQQMGLSFFLGERNDTSLIGHSGNQNGFISHIYIVPEQNVGYTIVFNSLGQSRQVDRNILDYLLEHIF